MKPRQFLIRNSDRGIWNYGVLLRWNILMMGRLSGLPIFILTNYNLAVRVPLTAIPNRESRGTRPPCESRAAPSSPSGETSARSADTPCGARLLCAPARSQNVQKALKGCGGKQEFSPTSNTLSLLSLSSETVRRTVSERSLKSNEPRMKGQ